MPPTAASPRLGHAELHGVLRTALVDGVALDRACTVVGVLGEGVDHDNPIELVESLGRVRLQLDIQVRSAREPGPSRLAVPARQERIGIRVGQSRAGTATATQRGDVGTATAASSWPRSRRAPLATMGERPAQPRPAREDSLPGSPQAPAQARQDLARSPRYEQ